jgi:hypothetical protein
MTANVLRGVSITLLMSPTAYHRLRCGGAAFLIAHVLFGTASAAATGIAAAALRGGLWFVLPLTSEVKDRRTGSDD